MDAPLDVGTVGKELFGRPCRLALALWIAGQHKPRFYQSEPPREVILQGTWPRNSVGSSASACSRKSAQTTHGAFTTYARAALSGRSSKQPPTRSIPIAAHQLGRNNEVMSSSRAGVPEEVAGRQARPDAPSPILPNGPGYPRIVQAWLWL